MELCQLFEQITLLERHEDVVDRLTPWKDDPAILLSFTDLPKIGIKPTSEFDTPLGIYTYPLHEIWQHLVDDTLPFAGERMYVQVLRAMSPVLELSEYGDADLKRDLERLRPDWAPRITVRSQIMPKLELRARSKFKESFRFLDDDQKKAVEDEVMSERAATDAFDLLVESAQRDALVKNAAGTLWNVTKGLAEIAADHGIRKPSIIWNGILRGLGYVIISDRAGQGIIHRNEPVQVVVLAGNAIRHVAMLHNVRKSIRLSDSADKLEVSSLYDMAEQMVFKTVKGDYAPKAQVLAASAALPREMHQLLMTGESHHFKLDDSLSLTSLSAFVADRLTADYRELPKMVEILTASPFLKDKLQSKEVMSVGLLPPRSVRQKSWAWHLFCKIMLTPERLAHDSASYEAVSSRPSADYVLNRVRAIFRYVDLRADRQAGNTGFDAVLRRFTAFIGSEATAAIDEAVGRDTWGKALRAAFDRKQSNEK